MRTHALLGLLVLAACDNTAPPSRGAGSAASASASSTPATTSVAAASTPSAAASAQAPAPVTDAEARDLLKRWTTAQNDGNFAAYSALYADRFDGVRRNGERSTRLDRAGWMREREAMFKKKTVVRADDIAVRLAMAGAEIHFTQTWESGDYKDTGTKVLSLAQGRGGLRIAREAMVTSQRAPVSTPPPLGANRFAFVVQAAAPSLVVDASPPEAWSKGTAALVSRAKGGTVVTRKEVDESKLPKEVVALKGQHAQLFSATGLACDATVKGFAMVSRVIPHFGAQARWDAAGDFATEKPATNAQIADDAWGLGDEGRLLVAEVDGDPSKCRLATWGRMGTAASPRFLAAEPASAALKDAAHAELAKLASFVAAQKDFAEERKNASPPLPATWDKLPDTTLDVRKITLPSGGLLVTARLHAATSCAFDHTVSAVWEAKADGTGLVLLSPPSLEETEVVPDGAADVDGNGTFELFLPEGILQRAGTQYGDRKVLPLPNRDCTC